MANEPIQTVVSSDAAKAAPEAQASPVIATSVVDAAVQAATQEQPVEAPKASSEASKSVLGEAIDKAAEQPTKDSPQSPEAKASTDASSELVKEEKNTEGGQSDEPASPPQYDPFKVPEGMNPQPERMKEFTDLLSNLEVTGKTDHALVQEFGQKAVDFHIAELKRTQEDLTKLYQTAWDKQKQTWKDTFLKDPELGGNRFQTTVDSALSFIRTHGGTAEQQTELRQALDSSGLGNHPAIIRIFAKAGRAMSEAKPLTAPQAVPSNQSKSKVKTLYG